jgi:hypothetical protein
MSSEFSPFSYFSFFVVQHVKVVRLLLFGPTESSTLPHRLYPPDFVECVTHAVVVDSSLADSLPINQ